MRIAIIIFSFIIAFTNGAQAADCSATNDTDCMAIAGCGWSNTSGCSECGTGYYSTATDLTCKQCTKPTGANFSNGNTGQTTNSCPWTLTCSNGTYWSGSTTGCLSCAGDAVNTSETIIGNGANMPSARSCTTCGTHAQPNTDKTKCQCVDETHYTQNSDQINCKPNVYTITLNPNGGNGGTTQFFYKYDDGVALTKNATSYTDSITITAPTRNKYNYAGYFTEATNGTEILSGTTVSKDTITDHFDKNTLTGNTTLYAHWADAQYQVIYSVGTSNTYSKYYSFNKENKALNLTDISSLQNQVTGGLLFKNWICTGCSNNQSTVNAGDIINEPANDTGGITLTAQWKDCPSGYYCQTAIQYACPIGATSEAGATAITKCFINNQTKFCDTNNCYSIRDNNTKIYYHNGP